MSDTRYLAHELVDSLPESQLRGVVEFLRTIVDPTVEALDATPFDDEEEAQDEVQALEEARRWLDEHAGKGAPHDEAMRRLGLA